MILSTFDLGSFCAPLVFCLMALSVKHFLGDALRMPVKVCAQNISTLSPNFHEETNVVLRYVTACTQRVRIFDHTLMYPTGRKFSLKFKFDNFANFKFAKFKLR